MAILTFDAYTKPAMRYRQTPAERTGLQRLFAAAVVSGQFRDTLIRKPEEALAKGYLGQAFTLTDRESTVIKSIRAENLADFAQKVHQALQAS
ncbi:MAG: hypothetical protein MHPDNHAH_00974 [Anaerolineales bacterium]|nr:hypothetical protein [Anaerolineales bacterium]WKZ46365.1 MAG: hypothetical protein QY306_11165 [Anaerolineales bacterium]